MNIVHINDEEFAVITYGEPSNPALVLITGFIGEANFWSFVVEKLSVDFYVITYDQLGTGKSGPSPSLLSMQTMTEDASQIIKKYVEGKAHIVGHSAGAGVALMLANEGSCNLGSIQLLGGWTLADSWMKRVFQARVHALKSLGPLEYAQLTSLYMLPPSFVAENENLIHLTEEQYASKMPSVYEIEKRSNAVLAFDASKFQNIRNVPTHIVGAKDDIMTPIYFSRSLHNMSKYNYITELNYGGHYFPRTNPDKTVNAILGFLNHEEIFGKN